MSREFGWGRDVFGLAIALQNLLWGLGQPFAGAIADRFGMLRVLCVGALLYAGGLADDALCGDAAVARSRRRRADRLRPVRLLVQSRAVGVRQAAAAGAARHRVRRRHRGGLVRPVPVRAARRRADRQFRLAAGADGLRRPDAADRAAFARAVDAAGDVGRTCRRRISSRSRRRSRKPSAIAPTCCWCSASSPAASSSPSSPCICRPIWSIAASPAQIGGWAIAAIGLFNIVGSLGVGWLQNRIPEALHPVGDLFHPRARRSSPSSRCRSRPSRRSSSARSPA